MQPKLGLAKLFPFPVCKPKREPSLCLVSQARVQAGGKHAKGLSADRINNLFVQFRAVIGLVATAQEPAAAGQEAVGKLTPVAFP